MDEEFVLVTSEERRGRSPSPYCTLVVRDGWVRLYLSRSLFEQLGGKGGFVNVMFRQDDAAIAIAPGGKEGGWKIRVPQNGRPFIFMPASSGASAGALVDEAGRWSYAHREIEDEPSWFLLERVSGIW